MIGAITAGLYGTGVPPVTNSYESIATQVLGSSQTTVTFSSIPQTYKHLQLRCSILGASSGENSQTRFNGDNTASNYVCHRIIGNGSAATAAGYTSNFYFPATGSTTAPLGTVIDYLDYTNTNKYKTVRSLEGNDTNGGGFIILWSGLWQSSSAINQISMTLATGSFNANSSFALYGIKG